MRSFFCVSLLNSCSLYLFFAGNVTRGNGSKLEEVGEIPWISNIIVRGMLDYYPYGETSNGRCSQQGNLIKLFSSNYTLWALRMIDSYSKGPSGLIYGNDFDYGHYDECISTNAFNNTIKGQFMMVSLTFWPKVTNSPEIMSERNKDNKLEFLGENDSYWNVIEYSKNAGNKRIKGRNKVNWAICVPDSCNATDVTYSINNTLFPVFHSYNLNVNITILEEYTYTKNEIIWSTGAKCFMSITLLLFSIVLIATFYDCCCVDLNKKYLRKGEKLLLNFSMWHNASRLTKKEESISVISGIKVISMFIIIYGHRMLITMFSPIHNTYDNEMAIGELLNTYYLNGILIVDTFLVITGFLSFNKMLQLIENHGSFNPIRYIFRRYMRFTPTYLFVLGFTIWIQPELGGGPMSRNVIWDSSDCSSVWWTHLLYINNYLHSDHQCIIPSWYLAADMQLYVFCSVIAFVIWKTRTFIGIALLFISSVISVVAPAVILLLKGYKGVTLLYLSDFASYFKNSEFIETYLQTHFRASPYVIGMIAAWIYRKIENSNLNPFKGKFKYLMILLTLLHLFSMNVSILSAWWFYTPGREYSTVDIILYSILHRLGWAVPVSWIIVLHSSNLITPFRKLLGLSIFGPLNKVSYSVFLIHTPLQLYLAGQNRTPVYYNWLTSWWMAAGDIIFCYGAAFTLHLLVEAPFMNLLLL